MSCHSEDVYCAYVDGELSLEERRPLEAHLVGCRDCRALVMALRDEVELIGDALRERERETAVRREASPARGLAVGTIPTVAIALLAASGLGWAAETYLPLAFEWLNPFRLTGAYDMVFNVIFWIEKVPGLLQFLVSTVAVVSFAALLTFALSTLTRRWLGQAMLCAAVFAAIHPAPASAWDLRSEDAVSVAAGETLEDTLVVYAETVHIGGRVAGDLFVLANRLTVSGEIDGNVFAIVRNLDVAGEITGSLHVFGDRAEVTGRIAGNVYSVCESYTLSRGGRVERDGTHFGEGISVAGEVGRDVLAGGEWLELRGSVARNVNVHIERMALLDGARVAGDLDAMLWRKTEIEMAPGAVVLGETRSAVHEDRSVGRFERFTQPGFYLWLAIELVAAFLVGLLLHALAPGLLDLRLETGGAFARSLGIGFLVVVATPVALVITALTLVGIPIAIIGGAVFLAAIYCSLVALGALVGHALIDAREGPPAGFAISLLAGLALLLVAVHLPFVGGLARVVAILLGLGLLTDKALEAWRARRPRMA